MFTRLVTGTGRRLFRIGKIGVLVLLMVAAGIAALPALAQNMTQPMQDQNIYMPLIPADGNGSTATPVPTAAVGAGALEVGARVYGLLGTLEQPDGMRYTYYLRTVNNGFYALAGETPEIEQQIGSLARSTDTRVKVWGQVQPAQGNREPPLIVVSGILATEANLPTPVAGVSVPIATVKYSVVNLYAGPGTNFSVAGQVVLRQSCEVTGRNTASSWLQLTCADGQQGWVDARLVEVTGEVAAAVVINVAVATPTPTAMVAGPTPLPTPQAFVGWRTELFNNPTLSGQPVAVTDINAINFDWGNGSPSQVNADGFSIRFSRRVTVSPAYYEFTAVADDGVRVWVDGRLIINAWPANTSQTYVVGQVLTGTHEIVVEYYEQSGLAHVRLDYSTVDTSLAWQADYYFGVTPSGNPAFSQQEFAGNTPLDYNWGTGSQPSMALGANVLGNDYWSARWQGEFPFESGNYVFRANADDGIRLYIDGLLVLDHWRDGYKEVNNRVIGVGQGRHTIVIEYYERTGNASVRAWWYRDSAYTGPQ